MRIGVDYRSAISSVRGIGYYLKSVISQLAILDKINTYYLYVDHQIAVELPSNFKIVVINCQSLILFEQFYLPRQAKIDRLDLLWYPSNSGPLFLKKNIKLILTIHDLVSLNRKFALSDLQNFNSLKSLVADQYRGFSLKWGLTRINRIISISKYTEAQIFKQLKSGSTQIYNHIHPLVHSKETHILNKLKLKAKDYIYTLTGSSKHKNLPAYLNLFQSGSLGKVLVISGVTDADLIEKHGNEYIIFTGMVTEEEKASLYSNASAFLFLSHHEGFGLPILEAMQFNIPIISSDRDALPEVVGDAGVLVNPDDYEEVKQALLNLGNEDLALLKIRQDKQVSKFSDWMCSAKLHLDLFLREGSRI